MTELRIGLLSSANIEFLRKPLENALRARGFQPCLWVGAFGQYYQDVMEPSSKLYEHDPSMIIIHLDGADLFQELIENPYDNSAAARREIADRRAAEVLRIAETLAERLPKATVVLNTVSVDPVSTLVGLEYNSEYGLEEVIHAYNYELAAIARHLQTVIVADIASLTASIGFENWRDLRLWCLARTRWSYRALEAMSERYTAMIAARLGRTRKCIVVDLDNTLWGGVVGEDGREGVKLGEEGAGRAYVEFQIELLNLFRKGILLAICSKNNPEDALAILRNNSSMRLRQEHFAAMRINWEDKVSNIRALAEELNIGLDSIVFLDDNPVERSWVRQQLPDVLAPDWPEDPSEYKAALLRLAAREFCKLGITTEDRRRGEIYQAQAERRKLQSSAKSLEDFYRDLQMRIKIGLADDFVTPRIAQLTQKTNQFNLTTRRYTESEIRDMSNDPNCQVWWLDLTDRFGPNGIVGVLILRRETAEAWVIDTFLLSCRVMGRTVEKAFLAVASRELGPVKLIGQYLRTEKNVPVKDIYAQLGFQPVSNPTPGEFWTLDLGAAQLEIPNWFEVAVVPVGVEVG